MATTSVPYTMPTSLLNQTFTLYENIFLENGTNATDADVDVDTDAYDVQYIQPEVYIVPILFAMIFIVGVLGNGTLIYIVGANKNMRNVPNMFIVSLAVGDLILIMVSVPLASTVYTTSGWHFGLALCKLSTFVEVTSLGVSVFTLVALSADRYVAIVDPMRRRRSSSTKRTATTVIAIWIGSVILAVPDTVITDIRVYPTPLFNVSLCEIHPPLWDEWHYKQIHTMLRFSLYFAIPIVVIAVFYYLMARMLIKSTTTMMGTDDGCSASLHSNVNPYQKRQLDARKKVAKVVLSFVLVFIVCWLPRHIYSIWFFMTEITYNDFWHIFKIIGFCLCFINSCVNPLALYFLSNQFRSYYNRYLFCFCARRIKSVPVTSAMYNFDRSGRPSSTTVTTMAPASQTVC